jgi:hypothetical protein
MYPIFGSRLNRSLPVAVPTPAAGAFVACPVPVGPESLAMWRLYQWAYEQARAVVAPSRLERLQPSAN